MKRLFAVILCLTMMFSLFPVSVFAEVPPDENVVLSSEVQEQMDSAQEEEPSDHEQDTSSEVMPSDDTDLADEEEIGITSVEPLEETEGACVRVSFLVKPSDAVLEIYAKDELGKKTIFLPEEDGSWLLQPGEYQYSATADGYEPAKDVSFSIKAEDTYLDIEILLNTVETFVEEIEIASTTINSGVCGEHLTWTLDGGTLTISGTGAMYNYDIDEAYDLPWKNKISILIIESGVTSIGDRAFQDCIDLCSVDISGTVTSIGKAAFHSCENLNYVYFPDSITSIGQDCFELSGLENVIFPQSLRSIGERAFSGCSGLTSIIIPASVADIGPAAFMECSNLSSIHVETGNEYYCNDEYGVLYNKDMSELISAPNAITGAYTIPDGVKTIWAGAFRSCPRLTSIIIPEGVDQIGFTAFLGCSSLTDIIIPSTVTSLVYGVFFECINLESITIPISVTAIGDDAFYECSSLSEVSYAGNQAYWSRITIGEGNESLTNAIIHFGSDIVASGSCGDHLTWTLDNKGVLTVSGTGAMTNFCYKENPPWGRGIKSVVIEPGVGSIGRYAFNGCLELTSITIPDTVVSIGNNAFNSCKQLTSITIPESVSAIGEGAFCDCKGLTDIIIPAGVTSIEYYAFRDCTRLTSVILPDSITTIGMDAFAGCQSLTGVTIPETVNSIEAEAFASCKGLTEIIIPDSVNYIGYGAFIGCTGLTSVIIQDSVTCVEEYAFHGCTGLADADGFVILNTVLHGYFGDAVSITIPETVTSIAGGAFASQRQMTDIVIPEGVTSIGNEAFSSCTGLTSVILPEGVTKIGYGAFYNCSGLESITIPDSVTLIKERAFRDCINLKNITMSDNSLTVIEEGAFDNCVGLADADGFVIIRKVLYAYCGEVTSITIPDSVTCIGCGAFFDHPELTEIIIPNSVTSFEGGAFNSCTGLVSITIPDSIVKIPEGAFGNCDRLTNVIIPDSVNTIGDSAFFYCRSLTSIVIPDSVNSIGESAFSGCSSLTSIAIPYGVTTIEDSAFSSCSSLTSIAIPDSVITICNGAFSGCSSLESISIPDSVTNIGERAFSRCTNLTDIVSFNGIISIDNAAFENCTGLASLSLPDGVVSIGEYAFSGCSGLNTITLPASITRLGYKSFVNCSALSNITFLGDAPSISYYAFFGVNATAYYPGTSSTYTPDNKLQYGGSLTWEPVGGYEISFDANGGISAPATQYKSYGNTLLLSSEVPGRQGYFFAGWATSSDSAVAVYQPNDPYSEEGNAILYAVWYKTYTIHYNSNGGTSEPEAQTKIHSVPLVLSSITPIRTGYDFLGWASSCDAAVAAYQPGDTYTMEGDATLYAVWLPYTYTICFNANGGEGAPDPQTKTHGTVLALSDVMPTRDGYDFLGWAVSADATEAVWQPGGSYTSEGDVTLYAVWQLKTYSVIYNANGGENAPEAQDKTHGIALALTEDIPVRDHHEFLGWAISADSAAAVYQPGDSYNSNAELVLYAVWREYIDAGCCAENLTWILYADGELVIQPAAEGETGAINEAPWLDYKDEILTIEISDGITGIGDSAFSGCTGMAEVSIPDTVTTIGDYAFENCSSLTEVELPDGLEEIGSGAFAGCSSLTEVVVPEGTTVAEDAFENVPEPPVELRLDHDYLLLKTGEEPAELAVLDLDSKWEARLSWSAADIHFNLTEENAVIDVVDGTITPKAAGTAYAAAYINGRDGKPQVLAYCRVDVVAGDPADEVRATGYRVSLPVTKATVEVFSTDYVRIPVVLNLSQNIDDSIDVQGSNLVSPMPELPVDDGTAIVRAEFAGEAGKWFALRVADDRTLIIVPKDETLQTAESAPKTIKGTQKAQIRVYVGETDAPFVANETITLTVKKSIPKVKAKALKFNSFLQADTQLLDFGGMKMTSVELDVLKNNPNWVVLNGDQSVSFDTAHYANTKQNGKLNLLVCPKGWTIKVPVAVNISATLTRPKLTFKPASLSLNPVGDDALTTAAALSPAEFADNDQCRLLILDYKEGKNGFDLMHRETWPVNLEIDPTGSGITVTPGEAMPKDGKAHTYKITFGATYFGNPTENNPAKSSAVLTIKLLAKKAPALSLKASGTIDLAIQNSPMTITPTVKNVGGPVQYEVTTIKDAGDVSAMSFFAVDGLTLRAKDGLATGKYTASVTAAYGRNYAEHTSKDLTFTVKRSSTVPAVSITLKGSGSIDVIRQQSTVVLTPTIKNWYLRPLQKTDLHIYRLVSKGSYVDETALFDVELTDGVYTVKAAESISHLNKYYACIKADDINSGKEGKMTALSVKMGAAKISQSEKSVMLMKHDRFSTATVRLSPADPTLSYIVKVTPDARSARLFDVKLLQNGEIMIAYKDSKFTTAKSATVKLSVFLDGNTTMDTAKPKANATISVKVNIG